MPQNFSPRLSVIGLGKLGLPAAAVFASKGFKVVGFDINPKIVEEVNSGLTSLRERGLKELMRRHKICLTATTDIDNAVLSSDISFVIVPTPSTKKGDFSNDFVLQAIKGIGKALRRKKDRHLVVICSTVMPGSTETVIKPCLEKSSGRKVGVSVGLCYNPEFIALGSVIQNMLKPDIVLIGESDKKSGDALEKIYVRFCENKPAVKRMNFVNAELTKISINTFVTTKITYANMLSGICDQLPNANCDIVTNAIGSDSRIGGKYLTGATGYGGPCFPRDNVAFAALAKKVNARADLAIATDKLNNHQPERLMSLVRQVSPKAKKIAVIGLSYKSDTPVLEESQGVKLAQLLHKNRYQLTAYDCLCGTAAKNILPRSIKIAANLDEAAMDQDVIIIMVPDTAYAKLGRSSKSPRKSVTIVDCWRILENMPLATHITLVHPGRHVKTVKR